MNAPELPAQPHRLAVDVLLDCCGAIALELLVYVFMRVFRPRSWPTRVEPSLTSDP